LTFDKTDEKSKVNQLIIQAADQEILKSPVEVKSPLPEPPAINPPTTPKSMNRAHAQTPPKGSPGNNRPPKRVHATTLTTFKTTTTTDPQNKEFNEKNYDNFTVQIQ